MNETNETMPNFFTQIPSYVMSSKELNSTDKCVYGVIYTMLNTTRKCFMSNERIGNDIGLSKKTVSKTITKLVRAGLLNVRLTYKNGTKEVDKRYITLRNMPMPQLEHTPMPQLEHSPHSNRGIPLPQSGQDNKSLNKLINSSSSSTQNEITLQNVISNIQRSNIGMLNGKNISDLQVWTKDMPTDVINYAVDIAADNNATSFKYIDSILSAWYQKNIKSIEEAKAYGTRNKQKSKQQNNQSLRGVESEEYGW